MSGGNSSAAPFNPTSESTQAQRNGGMGGTNGEGSGGGSCSDWEGEEEIACAACGFEASFVPEGMIPCDKCRTVQYCSQHCADWHWRSGGHSRACVPVLKKEVPASQETSESSQDAEESIVSMEMSNLFSTSSDHDVSNKNFTKAPPPPSPSSSSSGQGSPGRLGQMLRNLGSPSQKDKPKVLDPMRPREEDSVVREAEDEGSICLSDGGASTTLKSIAEEEEHSEQPDSEGSWRSREPFQTQGAAGGLKAAAEKQVDAALSAAGSENHDVHEYSALLEVNSTDLSGQSEAAERSEPPAFKPQERRASLKDFHQLYQRQTSQTTIDNEDSSASAPPAPGPDLKAFRDVYAADASQEPSASLQMARAKKESLKNSLNDALRMYESLYGEDAAKQAFAELTESVSSSDKPASEPKSVASMTSYAEDVKPVTLFTEDQKQAPMSEPRYMKYRASLSNSQKKEMEPQEDDASRGVVVATAAAAAAAIVNGTPEKTPSSSSGRRYMQYRSSLSSPASDVAFMTPAQSTTGEAAFMTPGDFAPTSASGSAFVTPDQSISSTGKPSSSSSRYMKYRSSLKSPASTEDRDREDGRDHSAAIGAAALATGAGIATAAALSADKGESNAVTPSEGTPSTPRYMQYRASLTPKNDSGAVESSESSASGSPPEGASTPHYIDLRDSLEEDEEYLGVSDRPLDEEDDMLGFVPLAATAGAAAGVTAGVALSSSGNDAPAVAVPEPAPQDFGAQIVSRAHSLKDVEARKAEEAARLREEAARQKRQEESEQFRTRFASLAQSLREEDERQKKEQVLSKELAREPEADERFSKKPVSAPTSGPSALTQELASSKLFQQQREVNDGPDIDPEAGLSRMSRDEDTATLPPAGRKSNMFRRLACAFLCFGLLGAGIGLGITFGLASDDDGDDREVPVAEDDGAAPTDAPTDAPTLRTSPTGAPVSTPDEPPETPTTREEVFSLLAVASFDNGATILTPDTPQNRAFEWLMLNSDLATYSDEQRIQRYGLAAFYYSTDGDNWSTSQGWLSDEDECSWYSLSTRSPLCDTNGSFINLDLGLNNLSGILPPELALLSNLRRVVLTGGAERSVSGVLPTELGLLTQMEIFDVHGNTLFGGIPIEMTSWTAVEFVDLSSNGLEGELPEDIGNMTSLRSLNLAMNELDGQLPASIDGLSNLEKLSLGDNRFEGIPALGSGWGQLRELNLQRNRFSSLPTTFGQLTSLERLTMSENSLNGPLITEIGSMTSLQELNLKDNEVSGPIPVEIGRLIALTDLNLSVNAFTGPIPTEMGLLVNLNNLELQNNQLDGEVPAELSNLVRLQTIRVDNNNLTGTIPEQICDSFASFLPAFYVDCGTTTSENDNEESAAEVTCPEGSCCTHCCHDVEGCGCEFDGTNFDFLC